MSLVNPLDSVGLTLIHGLGGEFRDDGFLAEIPRRIGRQHLRALHLARAQGLWDRCLTFITLPDVVLFDRFALVFGPQSLPKSQWFGWCERDRFVWRACWDFGWGSDINSLRDERFGWGFGEVFEFIG